MAKRLTRSDRELPRSAMSSSVRSSASSRATVRSSLRQPTARHAHSSSVSSRLGAVSPAESVASAGTKRKQRDVDDAASVVTAVSEGEATNINVVVRCRGRSGREVKENSTLVVQTDGVKGKMIELSMGANALSNKSYSFDRVFSQAADQSMIFDDTVKPILDEMLAGYNCTIFAYGQTGTGKTYTMSGDMTDTLGMLSDEAGIIPRVLQQLFRKLEIDGDESCAKVSFIELYNEELRDLLSGDGGAGLKIYDDASRRGHLSTVVQGMEEKHIKNAAEGIQVLQDGSLKRQVAATKCNDLSSRSHTVFTITTYVKKVNEQGGEDLVSTGKLNLVDLAGSENIQRSGAENKRAVEAGLINKSLLTLGRVINALVDRSSHIPYRESKLTRLLQDSLGGRTKTCIIATISPAKTNLEETISTLDYAFRAKNIKNKPQLNIMSKKTLLREFTVEIEKLKSELIATRQRNGVYLSNEAYDDLTSQNESRRIVMEEQTARMETLETNLRNKVQEFFSLTTSLMGLQKEHETVRAQLDDTQEILEQTDMVLSATRKSLAEETELRKAHQETEGKLAEIGGELVKKLGKTVRDVGGLHAKNKRKSDLQTINRAAWGTSQAQVMDVTTMVERCVQEFQQDQEDHISSISRRMQDFVGEELNKVKSTQTFLDEHLNEFEESKKLLLEQKTRSKEDLDDVLEEIKVIRDTVTERMGDSLQTISQATEKISAEVLSEMTDFHIMLHNSYSTLGKDCKIIFEDLVKRLAAERSENDVLRRQLLSATTTIKAQTATIPTRAEERMGEKQRQTAEDHQKMIAQFTSFLTTQREAQEARDAEDMTQLRQIVLSSSEVLDGTVSEFDKKMESRDEEQGQLVEDVKKSRDQLKTRMKDDWTAAGAHSTSIQNTAKSVHAETVRVVDEQSQDLDVQMAALDDFVVRARSENASHHDSHAQSMQSLSNTVDQSFGSISSHFKATFDRVQNLGDGMELDIADMQDGLEPLESQLCQPLANLREGITATALHEYQPTGDTPQKVQYHYTTSLPRTDNRDSALFPRLEPPLSPALARIPEDASDRDINTIVFADLNSARHTSPRRRATLTVDKNPPSSVRSLREVDPNLVSAGANLNLTTGAIGFDPRAAATTEKDGLTLFKRSTRGVATVRGAKRAAATVAAEGRENVPLDVLEEGGPKRKSPRLN